MKYSSGPNHQLPSISLADNLRELGFEVVRFKTGTPPRVNSKTIDYSKTEIQPGDDVGRAFSFETTEYILDQLLVGSRIQMIVHIKSLMIIYIYQLCTQV